jgi:aspartate ammonia-lyase
MRKRIEKDQIGEIEVDSDSLVGIHTQRALSNFNVSGRMVPSVLISAYAEVKLACARTNYQLGYITEKLYKSIEIACKEMIIGELNKYIKVDFYQGGAGTSTNLTICEVLANRTLQLLGKEPGDYSNCHPIETLNLHQSTNDTYPTALKVSIYKLLKKLETEITLLQEEFQDKEKQYSDVILIGRTELMDAVPMTFGRKFGAWAEAFNRDRWRVYKATERIRVVNLGGTAIGTGLGAPREYIFKVVDELRSITQLPFSRAENMVEATQNADVFVEVMGMLKAHAMNLMKLSGDLRVLSMGPDAGISELRLPEIQAGSSIMPNKVNPVVPEMMAQVAFQVAAFDQAIAWAVGSGQLELNAFLPLIAGNMIESLEILISTNRITREKCIADIQVNVETCKKHAMSSRAITTVLVPIIGYEKATEIAFAMKNESLDFYQAAEKIAGLKKETCDKLLTPEAVNALGFKITESEKIKKE